MAFVFSSLLNVQSRVNLFAIFKLLEQLCAFEKLFEVNAVFCSVNSFSRLPNYYLKFSLK